MTYFTKRKVVASQQSEKSFPGRMPDETVTVPGTQIEISLWTAMAGSRNAGQTAVGFDRITQNADGSKRRNRTFRFSCTDDLIGLLLGVIGSIELASQDETLAGNVRGLYRKIADVTGTAVATAMDPASPQVTKKQAPRLSPSLAAPAANGQTTTGANAFSLLR